MADDGDGGVDEVDFIEGGSLTSIDEMDKVEHGKGFFYIRKKSELFLNYLEADVQGQGEDDTDSSFFKGIRKVTKKVTRTVTKSVRKKQKSYVLTSFLILYLLTPFSPPHSPLPFLPFPLPPLPSSSPPSLSSSLLPPVSPTLGTGFPSMMVFSV